MVLWTERGKADHIRQVSIAQMNRCSAELNHSIPLAQGFVGTVSRQSAQASRTPRGGGSRMRSLGLKSQSTKSRVQRNNNTQQQKRETLHRRLTADSFQAKTLKFCLVLLTRLTRVGCAQHACSSACIFWLSLFYSTSPALRLHRVPARLEIMLARTMAVALKIHL